MLHQRVVDFYQFGNDDFRAIITSSSGKTVYASQITNDVQWCACLGYRFRGHCSHLEILMEVMIDNALVETQKQTIIERGINKSMEDQYYYKTSLENLNKVLMGGIPKGSILGFYGTPKCGKTTTAIWTLLDLMKQKQQNGLYIDTEMGMARQFLPNIIKRYNEKNGANFGINHIKLDYRSFLKDKSAIITYRQLSNTDKDLFVTVVDVADFKALSLLIGKPYTLDLESAKPQIIPFQTQLFPNVWDSPLARLLDDPQSDDEGYVGFVLDSFTNVMKIFGTDTQAFPIRDTGQSVVLNQMSQLLAEFTDMVGIVLFHASRNPAKRDDEAIPVGGKSVGHSCKTIVQFSNAKRKGLNTEITITPYRLPTDIGNLNGETITINNQGVF